MDPCIDTLGVWDQERQKYMVKGTGETSAIAAREVAKDYALSLLKQGHRVEREFAVQYFAVRVLSKASIQFAKGERIHGYVDSIRWAVRSPSLLGLSAQKSPQPYRRHGGLHQTVSS